MTTKELKKNKSITGNIKDKKLIFTNDLKGYMSSLSYHYNNLSKVK